MGRRGQRDQEVSNPAAAPAAGAGPVAGQVPPCQPLGRLHLDTPHRKRLRDLLLVVGCGVSVAELEKLGAKIERNEQGEVIAVSLRNTQITDARVADLQHQQPAPPRLAAELSSYR